ncbi:MAG: hypothetical protein JSR39_05150 [Verrucomicrobia bacterium]|nr:hypothetical protein [Verrucomicrobiota bacterium]
MPDLTLNASPLAFQPFANISLFDSLIQSDLEDPQWGEHHAFDHVLRFTDALERATQN